MRLGLVIYDTLDTVSGGYIYDRKLVEYLRAQGDEVEIISIPWRNYLSHLGDNLNPALKRRLHSLDIDIYIQDELNHPSLFALNRLLRESYPLVSIVHHLRSSEFHPDWQNRVYRDVERRYLSTLDGLICNSLTTQQTVRELVGRDILSLVAYPAGDRLHAQIEVEEIIRRAAQPGVLRLVFVGNVIPRKGLHVLLQALEQLPMDFWILSIVGRLDVDPVYTRTIRGMVEKSLLANNVRLYGVLEDGELADLLRASHLLVVPSSYEGFGIAYLEGMGLGLPAIATTRGAAWEFVESGVNGYLVEPEDPQCLASCLSRLFEDRQLLVELSVRARQRYEEHPTWDQTCAQIRKFLLKILER